jgi:hypothetical protein
VDIPEVDGEQDPRLDLLALTSIFSRPYFGRGWVMQEAALSRYQCTVFWGHAQIDFFWVAWAAFYGISKWYHIARHIPGGTGMKNCAFMCIMCSYNAYPERDLSLGFRELLYHTESLTFTDPRDRVYGLLGLRTKECNFFKKEAPFLEADYNLTKMEVYRNVTEKFTLVYKDLAVLSQAGIGEMDATTEWPSWVPHFDQTITTRSLWFDQSRTMFLQPRINPEPKDTADIKVSKRNYEGRDCLCLSGYTIDMISHIVSIPKLPDDSSARAKLFQNLVIKLEETYDSDCVARTATANHNIDGYPLTSANTAQHANAYRSFLAWGNDARLGPQLKEDDAVLSVVNIVTEGLGPSSKRPESMFYFESEGFCYGRCFFELDSGALGLGPGNCQLGDVVVLVQGGLAPYVLRPTEGIWRFVGECYVDTLRDHDPTGYDGLFKPVEEFCIF